MRVPLSTLTLKRHIPWQVKIGAKMLLARLPIGYRIWRRLNLFKHGAMERPEYAFDVFHNHYRAAFGESKEASFVGLELGPGDSLFSAVIARAFGASKVYLVDAGAFATWDANLYRQMVALLRARGFAVGDLKDCKDVSQVLSVCRAEYLTNGLNSLRAVPSQSVDFIWSHTVFQHIRKADFLETLKELRRIQRPSGVGSHRVDLRDCIGGALNNLRFQERTWESDFWVKSGFYTNRIRYTEMMNLFRIAGFTATVREVRSWSELPTPRRKLESSFGGLSDEELVVSGFDVILQ